MTMQSIPLSAIEPSGANPRRKFDRKSIEGLAASIRTDGLLQNLVVAPVEGKRSRFRIIGGERRYRAMKLLEQRGELPEDFSVPVEVRKDLSKDQSLRIATVENLQRCNLSPLEETAALTRLVHRRVTLEDVAAQTGLSATTIKRRLALNNLCKDAKAALASGAISLSQAEALTLGNEEAQRNIVERIAEGHEFNADDIKSVFLDDQPTLAMAIFPFEHYQGSVTTDLFAEDETSYFDDAEQFMRLQRDAAALLAAHHEQSGAVVELREDYRLPEWQYRKAKKREKAHVVINIAPSGRVDVLERVIPHSMDKATAKATADNPAAPSKPKAFYATPLCRYMAHRKSVAIQTLLLSNPRKAKEVALVDRLGRLRRHACIAALSEGERETLAMLEEQARLVASWLGLEASEDAHVWDAFDWIDDCAVYEAVSALTDEQLEAAHTLLTALSFGQFNCDRLDSSDSLFNRVARDLGADMRDHWRPSRAFLEKRSREQLLAIAQECGFAELHGTGRIRTYKKSELVCGIERFFESAHAAAEPSPVQQKAWAWLPEAMLFPAVDPSAPEIAADDEDEGEDDEFAQAA